MLVSIEEIWSLQASLCMQILYTIQVDSPWNFYPFSFSNFEFRLVHAQL